MVKLKRTAKTIIKKSTSRIVGKMQRNKFIIFFCIISVLLITYTFRLNNNKGEEIKRLNSELVSKETQVRNIDGELFFEKYRDRATSVDIQPIKNEVKLISPILKLYRSYPFIIEVNINNNWKFGEYSFTYQKEADEYSFLPVINKANEEYALVFRTWETEFTKCDFTNHKNDDLWTVPFEEVDRVHSDIGLLIVGKSVESGYFAVCQENVSGLEEKTTNWVSVTDIGFILIHSPEDFDIKIINEMIDIIRNTEITKIVID